MKNITHQQLNLPADVPVMVLPNASLFPYALLPLYIFEERYRAMLSWCLDRGRMFCIAQMKPGISEAIDEDDFYSVAGLGLIRACVENEDGTSQLVLQGLARVRLGNFLQYEPFRIAQISELRSSVGNEAEADALGIKVVELCRSLKDKNNELHILLNSQIPQTSSPEIISDFVSQAFIADPSMRQEILEELDVCERLRILIACLQDET